MKFLSFHPALIASTIALAAGLQDVADISPKSSLRGDAGNQPVASATNNLRALQNNEMEGNFLVRDINYGEGALDGDGDGDGDSDSNLRKLKKKKKGKKNNKEKGGPDETLHVEFADGMIYELKNINPSWTNGKGKGKVSGKDRIKLPKNCIVDAGSASIDLRGSEPEDTARNKLFDRRDLQEATTRRTAAQERNLAALHRDDGRMLQTGAKTVLAVKVVMNGDKQYSGSMQFLREKVFGMGSDSHNLKSQYAACSYDQLTFNPTPSRTISGTDPEDESTDIENGVVTIRINRNVVNGEDTDVNNAVTAKINTLFGVSNPRELADYVMYCHPDGTMGGIAYAYINSWNSIYRNTWCNSLSAQVHEVGHNLGFAHSGEFSGNFDQYGDQSGMMGYSYSSSDGPLMCFNSAKSWQTKWYEDKHYTVNPGANDGSECFNGNLYGIADYDSASAETVIIKIQNTQSSTDHYINFNRAAGINSGTNEGRNQVLVTTAGREGNAYAQSTLETKLSANGSYQIDVRGRTMVVRVESFASSFAYARVVISEEGTDCGPPEPTKQPTLPPTTPPTPPPTSTPTNQPTSAPTNAPSHPPTGAPTPSPTPAPTNAPTNKPTPAPTGAPTTGAPTSSPTPAPTDAPTTKPTPAPTGAPTTEPTPMPTNIPTPAPSGSPINPLTPTPTNPPTPAPTNASTPGPTPQPTSPGPTPCTGADITVDVLTDNWSRETAWTLTNSCTSAQINSPTSLAKSTRYLKNYCLPAAQYTFEITDTYGDGICCSYGQGSVSVVYNGNQVLNAGAFGSSTSKTFGTCVTDSTPPPTPSPTPAGIATFNPILGVPKCSSITAACTSGSALLDGTRGNQEPNSSNTLDGCIDGANGKYHRDESVDQITVSTIGGGSLQAGALAVIEAKVWAWNDGSQDMADFYYSASTNNPEWKLIGSRPAGGPDERTLSIQYTLPSNSPLQAVRVSIRYQGSPNECPGGGWDESDDLVFAVDPTPSSFAAAAGAQAPIPVPPPKAMDSSHCAAIGEKDKNRCEEGTLCVWRNGRNKGCYPKTLGYTAKGKTKGKAKKVSRSDDHAA